MKLINKAESGRSMIEMLGVLAIIGVLSVGGLAGYNMAMRKVRINNLISELNVFITDMGEMYSYMKSGTTGESATPLADTDNLVKATNALGASFFTAYGTGNMKIRFIIGFSNLNSDACTAIASLQMENTDIGKGSNPWYHLGKPEAIAWCANKNDTDNVVLIFYDYINETED
jgi:type II secretory pathway pseudopilin PulG